MEIGYSALAVGLIAAIISFISFIYYLRKHEESLYNYSRIALLIQTLMLSIATITLLYYFLIKDFNVEYVALYSERSLSLPYTIGAIWGGASGSLLFWAFLLSIFMAIIALRERKDRITGYALAILLTVNIFFISLLLTYNDPFIRLNFTPADGQGLNPLLLDPGMLIHPPTLFVGYAGLTIPFAFALAGLLSESEIWVFRVRKWTIFSWGFLGLGIFLGGWWSYTVLGWGGYWAWDPVENSSLVPWLFSSALLHSVMLQESRRGMKLWNILLSIGTFATVILATFLTRSGVISSVHAFGESSLGPLFSTYLGISIFASIAILIYKFDQVRSMNIFQSISGRETSFLFNNLFFVVMGLTVVWGTLFPMINEAVIGSKISVGPGFYNAVAPWIILSLVILMGLCIILRWGFTNTEELIKKLRIPMALTIAFAPVIYIIGLNEIGSMIGLLATVFAVSLHIQDYLIDVKTDSRKRRANILSSMLRLILVRRRRYGGYIVHISMLFIFVGLIGTTIYQTTYTSTMQRNSPVEIGDYTFTFQSLSVNQKNGQVDYIVNLEVKNGNFKENITPTLIDYQKRQTTIVDVGVLSLPFEDIYVIPDNVSEEQVSVTINYTPLIYFLWIGGPIMMIGVFISLLPKRLTESKND